ncbi:MAG: response regulator transcription factor [Actinomycetota bacterium]
MVSSRPRARVLIVDDDPLIRSLLQAVLEDQRFTIDVAASGEEALEVASSSPPDVVILDVMMPGINGYDVCRALRASPATKGARVVMLTAKSESFDKEEALLAGADGFFTKPFSPLELIEAVNAALNGAA